MKTLYQIDDNLVYTGQSREAASKEGRLPGWVESETPPPSGVAQWGGSRGWITLAEYPSRAVSSAEIDVERDKRIEAGFVFQGVKYQFRKEEGDRENIAGAATNALAAIVNGATVGDYRWHGGDTDFQWIAEDNSTVTMDAQTMLAFGQAAMAHKQAYIFAARTLKDADSMVADYADNDNWP